jgi:metallophosphoesterase (TIGR00282 family)
LLTLYAYEVGAPGAGGGLSPSAQEPDPTCQTPCQTGPPAAPARPDRAQWSSLFALATALRYLNASMRILFFGDIVGRSGREALARHLPALRARLTPDLIVANGENAAHGRGITPKTFAEILALGVDCITGGNHIWDQREAIPLMEREPRLLRPLNAPAGTPGSGAWRGVLPDGRVAVVACLMGRLFMDALDCPFAAAARLAEAHPLGRGAGAILVDIHAEATSEKMALAHHLDGRVSAVIGTHTHIPTADTHVLPGGTAYMTDAGMCGDYDSVIGVRKDIPVYKFTRKLPHAEKMVPAAGEGTACGAFLVTDDATGHARSIEPVRLGGCLPEALPPPQA